MMIDCLTDRPCAVCKHHTGKGCTAWECVFEKEPIIDKIRAEIVEAKDDAEVKFGHPLGYDRIATYEKCLQIIDKYRQEG